VKANLSRPSNAGRGGRAAGAVTKDPQLEQIAQAYASEMAKQGGKVPKERIAEIEAPLYKSFATVNELGGGEVGPARFCGRAGNRRHAKAVGVGVGVGGSPQFGKKLDVRRDPAGEEACREAPAANRQPVKKR